MRLIQKILKL